eukprot:gene7196-5056_t
MRVRQEMNSEDNRHGKALAINLLLCFSKCQSPVAVGHAPTIPLMGKNI